MKEKKNGDIDGEDMKCNETFTIAFYCASLMNVHSQINFIII